jgi:hypothetical protein
VYVKTILAHIGLSEISPDWYFGAAVVFFMLCCLEITAVLMDRHAEIFEAVMATQGDKSVARRLQNVMAVIRLPAIFAVSSYFFWGLSNI